MENISINFMDQNESNIKIDTDLLIYGEKIVDSLYFKELKTIFKLCDYNNINFQLLNSSRKGVYLCGLCREDLLNIECNQDAIALSEEISEVLKEGVIEYENGVIDIDKKKCTLCLTCVRVCPHAAIEMDRDILDERVIKIYDEGCFHCGTCVGECPTKALTYKEEFVSI
jgi:heterodisulfide reductase subunit A-like polyferredoxin